MRILDPHRLLRECAWVDGHADVWRWFDQPETVRAIASALVGPFRGAATGEIIWLNR